jgi:hypothetical protein
MPKKVLTKWGEVVEKKYLEELYAKREKAEAKAARKAAKKVVKKKKK